MRLAPPANQTERDIQRRSAQLRLREPELLLLSKMTGPRKPRLEAKCARVCRIVEGITKRVGWSLSDGRIRIAKPSYLGISLDPSILGDYLNRG